MEYVYHMRDPKQTLLFLQDLHREIIGVILDSGVVFLLNNDDSDWYVFLTIENLTLEVAAQIDALLAARGNKSEYSYSELCNHPHKAFISSGGLEQVMDSLDTFGQTQRELWAERIRAKASLN